MRVDKLAACEGELSAIYENVPGIIFYIAVEPDGEFRFVSVSRDFLTATGLSREQVVGSLVRDVIPPPARNMVLNHYREAIRSGRPVRWEEKSVYPAGQRYGEVAVTPIYDASAVATHLIGIVHDITERKRLEEKRAEDLLEAAPDAMVVVDQTGKVILVNAQTERLFGYRREEILGCNVELLIPPRFHVRHRAHQITFFSQPHIRLMGANLELSGLRKDGTEFPIELHLSPMQTPDGVLVISAIRDITERKLIEQELATAGKRLQLAIESGSVGGWDYDLRSGHNVWFGKAHAQLGMTPDETEELHKKFWPRVHEDDRGGLEHALQVSKEKHEDFTEDFRVVWEDGTTHWLRSRGRYYYSENGEANRMLGISLDITQSKQAEQALRESEERLRLAMQAGRIYAYDWDVTKDVMLRSPEHVKILDLAEPLRSPRQEFVDKIHPDDRPGFLATITGLTPENPVGEVTYRVLFPDRNLVWLKSNGRGFFDAEGRLMRVIGMVADVTAQKVAEERLRASEERLRLAQWAARIGTFDLNVQTGVDMWAPETEALYGLPPGGFGGTWTDFENLVYPDDRERIVELGHEMMRTGQPTEAEWRVIWPDGTLHWIAGRAQVFMDDSGQPSRMLGVNLDVTERKRAEEALAGLSGRLIEAQEEERRRIAREIHDDYAQRLAMLALHLERLAEDLKDSSAEAVEQLQQLWNQVSEVGADLHSLSHRLHSSTLDTLGLVAGAKAFCHEFSEQQGMEVNFTHQNVPHGIPDDVALCLFRIVQETLRNVKRHSGADRAEVRLEGLGEKLRLSVVDRGRGFDVNKSSSGSGIGIRSMEERLRLLGGQLEVHSRPADGTRIEACLPVKIASRTEVET